MMEFPSLEDFRAWLESKPKDEVVSKHWECTTCPLAVFLKHKGAKSPAVLTGGVWLEDTVNGRPKGAPTWVREFVYWVDKSDPRHVTAEECLYLLDCFEFQPEKWVPHPKLEGVLWRDHTLASKQTKLLEHHDIGRWADDGGPAHD
jgi:hypothetical protein